LHKDRVLPYLRCHAGLSREGRVKLFVSLHFDLRLKGDFYIKDTGRRLSADSPYFWFDIVLRDKQGDGRIHRFWFVVDDRPAKYGVLRIEYVEETCFDP